PGDDDVGDERVDEGQESSRLLAILDHLFRSFAERRYVMPAQAHVPSGAREPGGGCRDDDGDITSAAESHDIPLAKCRPHRPSCCPKSLRQSEQKPMTAIAKSRVHLFRLTCNNKDRNQPTTARRPISPGFRRPRQGS